MVFFKRKIRIAPEPNQLSEKLQTCEERQRFLLDAILTVLAFLKEFCFDLKEIDVEGFKSGIDNLTEAIGSKKKAKKVQSLFKKQEQIIRSYIRRQKECVGDRESELRDIVNLLTKAVANLGAENEDYNQKIYEQSEKIEQITLLDDIKEIKDTLTQEIEQMRATVKEKQEYDRRQIESLSEQVSVLEVELDKAKKDSVRDGLTGTFNRRAFDSYLVSLLEKNKTFALLLLSVDNYPKIKGTYGNRIADRVVLAVAQECGKFAQNADFLSRYGEEVFAIALPGESLRNASKIAKHMSKVIAGTRYSVSDVHDGHVLSFNVNIGVSAYRSGDTLADVTGRADEALSAAKDSGRQRVVAEKARHMIFFQAMFRSIGFYGSD